MKYIFFSYCLHEFLEACVCLVICYSETAVIGIEVFVWFIIFTPLLIHTANIDDTTSRLVGPTI
jgi:hypothetical protein